MISQGLIELVSLFQNIYAKLTFLCWHWRCMVTAMVM